MTKKELADNITFLSAIKLLDSINLIDTDKYMRFSGVQIPESLDAFETFSAGLIPQVEVPYEEE